MLDTHFMGMTPLNDAKPENSVEYSCSFLRNDARLIGNSCITISSLASHPFGPWQPKRGDKTYMWNRDILTRQLPNMRSIVYGYDTELKKSQSVQLIPDLAKTFVGSLQTCGWSSESAKPIVFLAHSLGGLVLRTAMVQLEESSDHRHNDSRTLCRSCILWSTKFGYETVASSLNFW